MNASSGNTQKPVNLIALATMRTPADTTQTAALDLEGGEPITDVWEWYLRVTRNCHTNDLTIVNADQQEPFACTRSK